MKNSIFGMDFRSFSIRGTYRFSGSPYLIARIDIQINCNQIESDTFTFGLISDFIDLKTENINEIWHQ